MIKLYNTLTKRKEEFKSIKKNIIGIYSCGPTVYWDQHIGNMYAFTQWDVLVRFLRFVGYDVTWVVNITDVGHLSGDNEGDADTGEDRMEKGAKREGLTVWEVAEKYIKQYRNSLELLNISQPDVLPRATKHIEEQIKLAQKIKNAGYAYETKKGLVFDTSKFGDYAEFANLSLEKQKKREDVTEDPEKKLPWDFFLWVKDSNHAMKWDSPWGVGYPGWHIECTAMSTKYLGNKFDIHTGGREHIPIHHTNEIAQGYGAFNDTTANYWLHNGWLVGEDVKMSKSLGDFVTVKDLSEKGYDPLSLRYLILTSHYRKGITFSFKALDSASVALSNLIKTTSELKVDESDIERKKVWKDRFIKALSDDLNIPQALATTWEMVKSDLPDGSKRALLKEFDKILGLDLFKTQKQKTIPVEIKNLLKKRDELRSSGKYGKADEVRSEIENKGYTVKDTQEGSVAVPNEQVK